MKERISIDDSVISAIQKMSGGNMGAMSVCMRVISEGEVIDPDNAFGGLGVLLNLDLSGVYEERIWMLYKDVCKEDLVNFIAVIRAKQLGQITAEQLDHAINNRGQGIDIQAILKGVKERLPAFNV